MKARDIDAIVARFDRLALWILCRRSCGAR
jgi:hypothetical protein